MAGNIKAGIEHIMKVNTKADKMGLESGFSLKYFNDATKEMVSVSDAFFEFEDAIDDTSTTISGDHSVGETVFDVADAAGFGQGSSVKIGGNYYRIVSVNDKTITLKKGLLTAVADGDSFELSGRTGTYGVPVTFPNPGNYTIHITNFAVGMDNEAAPVQVVAATVDDVKTLLDDVKTEVDSVKSQVDLLDEDEVNGLSEKLDSLAADMNAMHQIMKDSSDVYFELNGDETGIVKEGVELTGDNSGAKGTVQYVEYDSDADVTKVTVQSVSGTFEADETVNDGSNSTNGTISGLQNNVINSVIEYVEKIKELLNEDAGAAELLTINKDLKHIALGDDTLEDGSDNPTKGKGLAQIFDEITSTHSDVTSIKDLAEDSTNGFAAIKTAVTDARSSIEGKIDALVDEDDDNSLISKVNAVKSVVDANKGLLEDGTNGLAAIMSGVNNISDLFADGGDIEVRIDAIDKALSDLDTAISDQTTHLDGKFDEVMNKLAAMEDTTKYSVFA